MNFSMKPLALVVAVLSLTSGSGAVWAQITDPAANLLLRQEQERLRQEQERTTRERAPTGVDLKTIQPAQAPVAKGGICHNIKTINFPGANVLDEEDRAALTVPFNGKCMQAGDIQSLMGAVTQQYIERGFTTTRAYLPAQDLSSGVLQILVQEGRIERFVVEGDPSNRLNLRWAVPAVAGELLNIRDLEQAVDQLNSVPGNKVTMDIKPGSQPGKSVVVFRNTATVPVNLQISADNQGSKPTGVNGASATVAVGGLLGLNETLTVTARQSSPHTADASSDSSSVSLNLPDGFATYGVSLAKSNFSTGFTTNIGNHMVTYGDSTTYALTAERVMARDQDSRHSVVASLSQIEGGTRTLADGGNLIQKTGRIAKTLGVGIKSSTVIAGGSLYFKPEFVLGLAPIPNTISDGPQGEFTKLGLDVNYDRRFDGLGQKFGWTSNFKGQYSRDTLLSSQQILVGSISSVRGFVNNAMSGDSGYYWRNELAWHTEASVANLSFKNKLFVGLDMGHVSNHDASLPRGSMTGYAFGLVSQFEKVTLDISRTKAHALPSSMIIEAPQTWVRVSYSL
jgi:hemolysin activation/secretion protein